MTRQHFNAIALTLRDALDKSIDNKNAVLAIAFRLADQFEDFNPNFNREYFLAVALGETE